MVSIHAPVKGATGDGCVCQIDPQRFNSRSREGSDRGYLKLRKNKGFKVIVRECTKKGRSKQI